MLLLEAKLVHTHTHTQQKTVTSHTQSQALRDLAFTNSLAIEMEDPSDKFKLSDFCAWAVEEIHDMSDVLQNVLGIAQTTQRRMMNVKEKQERILAQLMNELEFCETFASKLDEFLVPAAGQSVDSLGILRKYDRHELRIRNSHKNKLVDMCRRVADFYVFQRNNGYLRRHQTENMLNSWLRLTRFWIWRWMLLMRQRRMRNKCILAVEHV
jgi:hypothetical protein